MGPDTTYSENEFDTKTRKPFMIFIGGGTRSKAQTDTKTRILHEILELMASRFDAIKTPDILNVGGGNGLVLIRVGDLFGDGVYLTRSGKLIVVQENDNNLPIAPIGHVDISADSIFTEDLCFQLIETSREKFNISWPQAMKWRWRLAKVRTYYPP